MAISVVGAFAQAGGTAQATVSITTSNVGDVVVLTSATSSSTSRITAATSTLVSGGFTEVTGARISSATGAVTTSTTWIGTVTSVGTANISVTYTGTPGASQLDARQFTAGLGAGTVWTVEDSAASTATGGTMTYPTLTPASTALYVGYAVTSGTGVAGSTSGFVYNVDTFFGSVWCYNVAATGATAPTATQSGTTAQYTRSAALLTAAVPAVTATPAAATGTGAARTPIPAVGARPAAATGTGAALAPTVSTTGTATAAPGTAAGTGAARTPTVTTAATVPAGSAAGTGAARTPTPGVGARPAAATGTGAALAPTVRIAALPAAATGVGAARTPTVEGGTSNGAELLPDQLDGARFIFELALGADLTADPATWDWTDITGDVRMSAGVALRHGRRDEASTTQPATCVATLGNSDGAYSLGGQSINYPNIRRNTPVRFRVDVGDGGGFRVLFQGGADTWQPAWDTTGRNATVKLSASGTLRRLAQGTSPVLSTLRRSTLARTDVIAYWPCEEPKLAQSIASGLPDGQPMTISGSAENPFPKMAENDDYPSSRPIPEVALTTWRAAVPTYTSTGEVQLRFLAAFPELLNGTECILTSIFTSGNLARWDLAFENSGGGVLKLYVTNTSGTRTQLSANDFNANSTSRWYSVDLEQDGGNVDWLVQSVGLGYAGAGSASGSTAGTLGVATAVTIAPDGDVDELGIGHITVKDAVTSFTDSLPAFNAYGHELATDRVQRLCDEAGVPVTITGTSAVRMGPQPIAALVPLLRECEVADAGLLYDGVDAGLSYVAGSARVNAAVGLTIDASAGELDNPEPIDDDQRLRNQVTAERSAGGEATYTDADGPLGTAAVGVFDDTIKVNLSPVDDLIDYASRAVALGTVEGYRYPRATLTLQRDPGLASAWTQLRPSARVDIAGLSAVRAQHPAGTVSSLLEGYSQKIDRFQWEVTQNLSPYEPWRAGVWAPDSGPTPEYVLRGDTDGSELAASAFAGATSLSVATPSGPLWTTDADDFPLDVEIAGTRITVTAISGGSSPQTFTVTGSTVVSALPSGADVRLWRPVGLGLGGEGTPPFTGGDVASAAELRDAIGSVALLRNDTTVALSTIAVDAPGLGVPVDPFGQYQLDGYLAYTAGTTPELRVSLMGPTAAEGSWFAQSVVDGAASSVGNTVAVRRTALNVGTELTTEHGAAGSGGPMWLHITGEVYTGRLGGVVQLRFAQLTSSATAVTAVAGSWMRATKIYGYGP